MRRAPLAAIACAALLGGCAATQAPPGTQADQARIGAAAVPGRATRKVVFDSGYQAWLYQVPRGAGRYTEWVILFDPSGVVSKTRRGAEFTSSQR